MSGLGEPATVGPGDLADVVAVRDDLTVRQMLGRFVGWGGPAALVGAALLVAAAVDPAGVVGDDALGDAVRATGWLLVWVGAFVVVNRFVRRFLLDYLLIRSTGDGAPRLVKDVATLLLVLLTASAVMETVFDRTIVGLWAASGLLTVVIGLALQTVILDFFVGLALQFHGPCSVGDWIEVDGTEGQVQELGWRTVRIQKSTRQVIFLPNRLLAQHQVTNHSRSTDPQIMTVDISVDFDVPHERASRIVEAAARSVAGECGILADPAPASLMTGADHEGKHYKVVFHMWPYRECPPYVAKAIVTAAVTEHLRAAGLGVATPVGTELHSRPHVPRIERSDDHAELLAANSLLRDADPEVLTAVASEAVLVRVPAGTRLSEPGQVTDTVDLVVEGMAVGEVEDPCSGRPVEAYRVEAGSWLGESPLVDARPSWVGLRAVTELRTFRLKNAVLADLAERSTALAATIVDTAVTRRRAVTLALRPVAESERLDAHEVRAREFVSGVRAMVGRARAATASGGRLLVVDDSTVLRAQVRQAAEAAGWTVVAEGSNGREGVEQYRDHRPDLVTLDLVMPEMDGLEALAEIRRIDPDASVVMVSAIDQETKRDTAAGLGALDFVVKPFDLDDLTGRLAALRHGRRDTAGDGAAGLP